MAADKTPDQEPSIEEILASIRQIISDDEEKDADAPAAPPPPSAPEPAFEPVRFEPEPEEEEDVLELTEAMEEPESFMPSADFEIDLQDQPAEPEPQPQPVFTPEPPPSPAPQRTEAPMQPRNTEPETPGDILTDAARAATLSSMAKLAGNMPITRHRDYGNITLEDLVREMLHPMLKDWLSDNLPQMVERVVQRELEKLARQAQDV